jgi:transcriptional regulator with XRE-family HTH domain
MLRAQGSAEINDAEIGRRIKAARALGGYTSTEGLAEAINETGLGEKTLRKMEAGERHAEPSELHAIAHACGLPDAFFYADFHQALGATPPPDARAAASIAEVTDQIAQIIRDYVGEAGD